MAKIYKIKGMDCDSCAKMLELDFEDVGIEISCSYEKEELSIESEEVSDEDIEKIIKEAGYEIEK